MTKILTGIAALMLVGAAALPFRPARPSRASRKRNRLTSVRGTADWRHHRYYGHRY